MKFVIDASVAVRWFIINETHANAEAVLRALIDGPEYFSVPELFAFEVFSVLLRIHPDAYTAFREGVLPLLQSGLLRYPLTENLLSHSKEFTALGLTGYDAMYAALARELNAIWLTYDQKAHRLISESQTSAYLGDSLPEELR